MSIDDYIVSLDIGTSKVRVIIGEINNGALNIIGVGSSDSEGIKKGAIVDIDQTVASIRNAVQHAEQMVGISIQDVFIGIAGNHIQLLPTQGVVAVSSEDREIGDEDIERVIQASRVIAIPPEREIIDVVPKQFVVDGLRDIKDPRGMIGVRLEMEGTIITGSKTVIHNVVRCIQRAGLSIAGIVLQPLAASEIALSKDDKNLGVFLLDIGAGSTTLAYFEDGYLAAHSVLPIGGEYITHDITIGLRTHTEISERIKLKYGCASIKEASTEETFKVPRIGSDMEKQYSQYDLANIIEPRVEEIFTLIHKEISKMGVHDEIPGGFVLTGGVVAMPGILLVAKEILPGPVRIAMPDYIGVRDPSFTTGVGIIRYASKQMFRRVTHVQGQNRMKNKSTTKSNHTKSGNLMEKMKDWLKEFI
ncbi:cell division protein FtsA [Microaerobacter geothermalis]|uniref:cell division protein FtsA n=1 Tax=Microaerobacter geothermalis TaxID=674972 RepID=UPI001F43CA31|nr:cell division protein FtsA [Microaerobacter geothermalis]MCF6093609.1 cell division protein FtsA [Microaerobacter geothermalis]